MEIEILGIRPLNGDKPLKAFVDVRIYDLICRDFRVVSQGNGCNAYVESPQIVFRGSGGVKQFKPFITMSQQAKVRVDTLILAAYFEMMEEMENGREQAS